MTTSAMSKGFFEFVKSIGEAKSKQEEDRIIENEMNILKTKMAGRGVADRQMREYLIRMVYVEMLGHDASFGHIHGVKLTRARKLVNKRVGYMACSLCLHKDHELMLLLVGGLQTDLQSQNQLEVATALVVACKLINEDTIPALLPLVTKLLGHNEASIRKKAIMTLQRFFELSDSCIADIADKAKRMLCDKDPSVMGASLHLLFDLIDSDVNSYKDLVSSFVSILKQIIEHRLPKDYDYHRMPAPWVQIKLLQILSLLGTADKTASEGMYEVLHEVMRRADIGINVGYAIIYECVRTVTTIFPNPHLLAEAAKCTSRFITSENHNLKYLGINALASIVQVQPQAANEHQMVVIDCLEDKDETLRRKTLDLLYRMTNEHNVQVICAKLIASLKDSVDVYLRTELIEKITSLAEKFAPDTIWFIETMAEVFEMGAELVKSQLAHNFIRELAEGIQSNEEDEDSEEDIGQYAADFFYELLDRQRIPNILLKVIAWVLGEYGQYCTGRSVHEEIDDDDEIKEPEIDVMEVIRRLWDVVEKQGEDSETRQWAMSATSKLCRHLDDVPPEVEQIVTKYKASVNSELQQLSHELIALTKERETMLQVFAETSIVNTIRVDPELKFLNNFVQEQLNSGKSEYNPPNDEDELYGSSSSVSHHPDALKLSHRVAPTQGTTLVRNKNVIDKPNAGLGPSASNFGPSRNDIDAPIEQDSSSLRLKSGKSKRWGPGGYGDNDNDEDEQQPQSTQQSKIEQNYVANVSITTVTPEQPSKSLQQSTPPITNIAPSRKHKTDKEIAADALFFGLPAGNRKRQTRPKRPKRPKRNKKKIISKNISSTKTTQSSQSSQQSPPQEEIKDSNVSTHDDLLDFGMSNTVASNEQKVDTGDDLLDFLGGSGGGDANNGGQTVVSSNDPMLDLLGDLSGPSNVQSIQQTQSNDPLDIFGSLNIPSNTSNTLNLNQSKNNGNINGISPMSQLINAASIQRGYNATSLKNLKHKLDPFPRSHDTDKILISDSCLQISYFKVYKQSQTNLCIFISNLTENLISNIMIAAASDNNMANNLHLGLDVGNSVPSPKLKNAHSGIINLINSNDTSCQIISFGANIPMQLKSCNINIGIQYTLPNTQSLKNLNVKIQVTGTDILRPSVINTNDFGQNWINLNQGNEVKFFIKPTKINGLQQYVDLITKLHFHHIQTIQNECIAAGQISSVSNPQLLVPCLVHAKMENGGFTMLVRTSSPAVSNTIAMDLRSALA